MSDRPCTCHPDDSPPVPCAKRYALTECKAAAYDAMRQRVADLEAWHAAGYAGQLESRLAAAEAVLRKIADHAEESPAQAAFWARQALAEARHD